MSKKRRLWTDEEKTYLRDNWISLGLTKCVEHLGRSEQAVRLKASRYGVAINREWTENDLVLLSALWGQVSMSVLSRRFNRSAHAIRVRANMLKLPRDPDGCVTVKEATEITGYSEGALKPILKAMGVHLKRSYTHHAGKRRYYTLNLEDVKEAVAAWSKMDNVCAYAKTHGMPRNFVKSYLLSRGQKPQVQGRRWRAPITMLDAAYEWFQSAETVYEAAERVGRCEKWFRKNLRDRNVEMLGFCPVFVQKVDVDATIAYRIEQRPLERLAGNVKRWDAWRQAKQQPAAEAP